jgi:hypothetical protein
MLTNGEGGGGGESRTIDCRRKDPICRCDPSTCTGCSQAQTSFLASKTSCSVDEGTRTRTSEGHDQRMHDNKDVNVSTRRQVACRNFKWRVRTLRRAWPPNACMATRTSTRRRQVTCRWWRARAMDVAVAVSDSACGCEIRGRCISCALHAATCVWPVF